MSKTSLNVVLECPVCMESLRLPITSCTNGHAVCCHCRPSLQKCPLCKQEFTTNKNTVLEQVISLVPISCRNRERGCLVQMLVDEMKEHEPSCVFRQITCSLGDCSQLTSLSAFPQHIEDHHNGFIRDTSFHTDHRPILTPKSGYMNMVDVYRITEDGKKYYFYVSYYMNKNTSEFFACATYLGGSGDAEGFVYTIKVNQDLGGREFTYSNLCLPFLQSPDERKAHLRCLVVDPKRVFPKSIPEGGKVVLSVNIARSS